MHQLVLDWNINYLLYTIYLILLNGLTIGIVSIIRLFFGFNVTVFGKNNKKSWKRRILISSLALLVGMLNATTIFFYMFQGITINFIIISFIPVLLVICLSWSIRVSCIAAIPSIITYLLVGTLYLRISFFDVLTPIFALLILFTGTIFCKVYNIQKMWQILLMQTLFSLFCAIVMSITLNSADNIYVNLNGQLTVLKDVKMLENFSFYLVNIILVNITSNFVNLLVFLFFYYFTKKLEGVIQNALTINNLSYYSDGNFVNNSIGIQKIKEEIKNDEFYLNISIFLPNISSIIKEIRYIEEKEIKTKIIKNLEFKFKKYNPIYYKNRLGFYCLLISLKDFNITSNLNEIYNRTNPKYNELYELLENYVTMIRYNNKEYPYLIKNFMSLYGIHTYDLNELEDISYKLYKEHKNSEKNIIMYNPTENIIQSDTINFNNIPEIDKTMFNITFLENQVIPQIIEPNISYTPYLLIKRNELFEYLEKIDKTNKIKRYLALEVLKKFKDEPNFNSASLVIDYPEQPLVYQDVDIQHLIKKINELGYETDKLIFRFSNQNFYEDVEFINILKEFKKHKIQIWLSKINSDIFLNHEHIPLVDYISFDHDSGIKKPSLNSKNNFKIVKEYI